jgi:hypothetical protein
MSGDSERSTMSCSIHGDSTHGSEVLAVGLATAAV